MLWGQIRLRQNETISFTVTCVTFGHTKIDEDLSTLVEKDVYEVTQGRPKKGNSTQRTQTSLRRLEKVTTSYRRGLICDVLKTSDLRRLEDV